MQPAEENRGYYQVCASNITQEILCESRSALQHILCCVKMLNLLRKSTVKFAAHLAVFSSHNKEAKCN